MNNNLDVVVGTCDTYLDAMTFFDIFFRKHMKNFNKSYYIIGEKKNPNIYNTVYLSSTQHDIPWSTRVSNALSKINSKYILFLLDDYFIAEDINFNKLCNITSIMDSEGILYFRLINNPKSRSKKTEYSKLKYNSRYGINLQAAIWSREHFIEILNKVKGTAWGVEEYFLKESYRGKNIENPNAVSVNKDLMIILNGIIKGKWVPGTIKKLKMYNLNIVLGDRLTLSKREIYILRFKSIAGKVIPSKSVYFIKKILNQIGLKTTTKY